MLATPVGFAEAVSPHEDPAVFMPGSQPSDGYAFTPSGNCTTCHGGYDAVVEADFAWKGSMMGNAARDPLFYATMTIANQVLPSWVGKT